jgi:Lrp/AsnC family transcriptional regulator, leucine-responsive regulatory protein
MGDDLDFIDLKILEILQRDGRASHSAIAEAVGLSQPSIHERVKKLEQGGVIKGYTALVDPDALDLGVLAFVSVRFHDILPDKAIEDLQQIPQVLEAHLVAGDDCLMVKARCRSTKDLRRVVEQIWHIAPVASTKTTIAFSSCKETTVLPVEGCLEEAEERSA